MSRPGEARRRGRSKPVERRSSPGPPLPRLAAVGTRAALTPLLWCAAPMALYDLTLILDAEAPEDRRTEIVEGVRAAIEADGLLRGAHDWGVRRLAYEI